jgi:hypothetical protein
MAGLEDGHEITPSQAAATKATPQNKQRGFWHDFPSCLALSLPTNFGLNLLHKPNSEGTSTYDGNTREKQDQEDHGQDEE